MYEHSHYIISLKKRFNHNVNTNMETNYKKRRHSFGTNDGKSKKRKKNGYKNALPTKFLLGGNINDPLNLSGLKYDSNQVTPQSSPLPTPAHRNQVEVLIPANINDPLNLNSSNEGGEGSTLISPKVKSKCRKRKRKRTESESSVASDCKANNLTLNLTLTLNDHDNAEPHTPVKPSKFKHEHSNDKIVSPAIPQETSIRHKKFSEDKSEEMKKIRKLTRKNQFNSHQFKEKDARFQYGNYNRYYGYRNGPQRIDSRLESLKIEWFENKDVLDIGCNVGHVTLQIARDFRPNKIIGLDIDKDLIKTARKNARHYIKSDSTQEDFPISLPLFHGPLAPATTSISSDCTESSSKFPNNIFFVQGNYVLENDQLLDVQQPEYDCILCLSLTKWIHLNWGDDGLKRVFKRIFAQLKPDGRLILETQPWSSYKRKKKLTVRVFYS